MLTLKFVTVTGKLEFFDEILLSTLTSWICINNICELRLQLLYIETQKKFNYQYIQVCLFCKTDKCTWVSNKFIHSSNVSHILYSPELKLLDCGGYIVIGKIIKDYSSIIKCQH